MNITIFAKERQTADGRKFTAYTTRLTRKSTGAEFAVSVKFRESCGAPDKDKCPCIIYSPKSACNLAKREYTDATTGEVKEAFTLWVTQWERSGDFVDTSLDDIADADE